jgi:hypothetical protein
MFQLINNFLGNIIIGIFRLGGWGLIIGSVLTDMAFQWSHKLSVYLMENYEQITTEKQGYCLVFVGWGVFCYIVFIKMYPWLQDD